MVQIYFYWRKSVFSKGELSCLGVCYGSFMANAMAVIVYHRRFLHSYLEFRFNWRPTTMRKLLETPCSYYSKNLGVKYIKKKENTRFVFVNNSFTLWRRSICLLKNSFNISFLGILLLDFLLNLHLVCKIFPVPLGCCVQTLL